ncbi:MAG TPA: response regulator, partial [Acidimicrobiales bacterium]|nr:response regulator [Acidimicrobiales bacterium]
MTLADVEAGQRELTATVRVLVVDDVPDIRKLIRMTLERVGPFDVVGEAGDGQFAIVEAARLKPDIVLLDLSMPIMDGLEALPEILAASPESKVLVLSGFTAGEMGDEAIRLGAAGYMEKGGIVGKLGPRLRELVPFRVAP